MPEEKQEDQAPKNTGGNLSSPDGILMLCIAGILDALSFIPVLNWVTWVLGIIIIGGWLVITRPKQAIKKAVKKFLIVLGIEVIPVVSAAPSWTWFVYKTLKES